jgi:hypothetical protein
MKRNVDKYETVAALPENAMSVPNYAKEHGHTTQYIYNMLQKGKANFKIVVYQGFNFVIPHSAN